MQFNLDFSAVTQAAIDEQWTDIELFGEIQSRWVMTFNAKASHSRSHVTRGLHLQGIKGGQSFHLRLPYFSTDLVLCFLKSPQETLRLANPSDAIPSIDPQRIQTTCAFLLELIKTIWNEPHSPNPLALIYEEVTQDFFNWRPGSEPTSSQDGHSRLNCRWESRLPTETGPKSYQCFRNTTRGVLKALETGELHRHVNNSHKIQTTWPMPQGNLNLVFSSKAFAKLLLPIVESLEADNLLKNQSLLCHRDIPTDWQFSVCDHSPHPGHDTEGETRSPVTLVSEGQIFQLVAHRKTAHLLGQAQSGRARRESYQTPTKAVAYCCQISPHNTNQIPWESLSHAIWVEDLSLHALDAKTGNVTLALDEPYLLHREKHGERLEKVTLSIDLFHLLSQVTSFSPHLSKHGFERDKDGLSFITELETPIALAPHIPIQGTVPSSHYW